MQSFYDSLWPASRCNMFMPSNLLVVERFLISPADGPASAVDFPFERVSNSALCPTFQMRHQRRRTDLLSHVRQPRAREGAGSRPMFVICSIMKRKPSRLTRKGETNP